MKLKYKLFAIFAIFAIFAAVGMADDLVPTTATFTNSRTGATAYIDDSTYYKGSTLRLTNVMFLDNDGSTQNMNGLTVECRVGSATTNVPTTLTATGTTTHGDVTIITNVSNPYLQFKLSDTNGSVVYYPWKIVRTQSPLE